MKGLHQAISLILADYCTSKAEIQKLYYCVFQAVPVPFQCLYSSLDILYKVNGL